MKTTRFGDEIGYKAGILIQKRAECDFKSKFLKAKQNVDTNSNLMMKAVSSYTLYLFYHHGWGEVSKNDSLALKYLMLSMNLGYPAAGMDLARYYLKEKAFSKAEDCIQTCNKEFFKRDHCEQEKYKEEHNDMMQLLKVIRSVANDTEDLSDEESIGGSEEECCSDIYCSPPPKAKVNKFHLLG